MSTNKYNIYFVDSMTYDAYVVSDAYHTLAQALYTMVKHDNTL